MSASAFDEQCYVRTDWVTFAKEFFSDAVRREAILDLRRLGFAEVALRDGEIQANWPGFDPEKHDQPSLDSAAAVRLVVLADSLPQCEAPVASGAANRRRVSQILLWTALICFALTIFFVIAFEPLSVGELLVASLPLTIPGYLLLGWIAAWLLRGSSTSHDRWASLMATALLLVPLGGVGTTSALNGLLDTSPPVFHSVKITDKTTSRSRNSTTYDVVCPSWVQPGSTVRFSVSHRDYDRALIGVSEMHVICSAGRLRVEWIRSRQLVLASANK